MRSRYSVLIVEDEEGIQQLVSYNLIRAGFLVQCTDSGEEALEILGSRRPDCIILDLMLPGISGLDVCRAVRSMELAREIPILMLTARGEEADIVAGLAEGADDYITKPFSPKVLVARTRAVIRRRQQEKAEACEVEPEPVIELGDLRIDPARFEVVVGRKKVRLTVSEFAILKLLASRAGWVFSRQQILDAIRGSDYAVTPRAVDVHIFSLRKKLGGTGRRIEAVRGIGYRFQDGG